MLESGPDMPLRLFDSIGSDKLAPLRRVQTRTGGWRYF
jgi:hypothetical protein